MALLVSVATCSAKYFSAKLDGWSIGWSPDSLATTCAPAGPAQSTTASEAALSSSFMAGFLLGGRCGTLSSRDAIRRGISPDRRSSTRRCSKFASTLYVLVVGRRVGLDGRSRCGSPGARSGPGRVRSHSAANARRRLGYARGAGAPPVLVRSSTVIADETTLATSDRFDGTMSVFPAFARLPNAAM